MPDAQHYRWPTKLKKFGITDPFQRMVVAKYEGEIPWQAVVKDAETLDRFIVEQMLSRIRERVKYPPRKGVKHHYVSARHVDLDLALATDPELDATDKGVIELIRAEDGEAAAIGALLELVNGRKADAFGDWVERLEANYAEEPAFRLLLLRPLFDLSGPGTRRPVVPFEGAVVEWLHRRILEGRILPHRNLGRVYCWRLGSGGQRVAANGWQYVPQGTANAHRLAAAARGSGWCVAYSGMAASYLGRAAFFILRHDSKPVVALRVQGTQVVECQGRHNNPPAGWQQEVQLFAETMGLEMVYRTELFWNATAAHKLLAERPLTWWRERARFWPFAASRAPEGIRERLLQEGAVDVSHYVDFPGLHRLLDGVGICLGLGDWCQIVEADPNRFQHCPEELRQNETLRAVCAQGWRERVKDGDVTLEDLAVAGNFLGLAEWCQIVESDPLRFQHCPRELRRDGALREAGARGLRARIEAGDVTGKQLSVAGRLLKHADWRRLIESDPSWFRHCPKPLRNDETLREVCTQGWLQRIDAGEVTLEILAAVAEFVRADQRFKEAIGAHFPEDLYKRIRRPARTLDERTDRLRLEKLLPATVGESRALALNRGVNVLLANQDGDYRDDCFPEALRTRDDFPAVRQEAWLEAMLAHPPLWFALPDDLKTEPNLKPVVPERLRVDLEQWTEKLREKPWLLTQQTGVPKTIRRHPRILRTYRDGWAEHVRSFPWRLWKQRGMYRRVYASYALLCDGVFQEAMEDGWGQRLQGIGHCWGRASNRMRNILPVQLAALRAIQASKRYRCSEGAYMVMLDIRDHLQVHPRLEPGGPLVEEITNRLMEERLYLTAPRRAAS